jgi:hypothetical protein
VNLLAFMIICVGKSESASMCVHVSMNVCMHVCFYMCMCVIICVSALMPIS